MNGVNFELLPGEKIILRSNGVKYGFLAGYTDELVLTNYSIVLVQQSIVGLVTGVKRFDISNIKLSNGKPIAVLGKSQMGEKQLQVYFLKKAKENEPQPDPDNDFVIEEFSFGICREKEILIWAMAIKDRFEENSDKYDFDYYRKFNSDVDVFRNNSEGTINSNYTFGDITKSVYETGKTTVEGIVNGVKTNKAINDFKENVGLNSFEKGFEEFGNKVCEALGIDTTAKNAGTYEKEDPLKDLKAKYDAQPDSVSTQSANTVQSTSNTDTSLSIDAQIETVKKLKELADAGILTQEEFERKKKEVMNL